MAVFTEADCATLDVSLGFTLYHSPQSEPIHFEHVARHDVRAGQAVEIVFGQDEYPYGLISDVTCLDAAALDSMG
ncbi:hypothetical protein LQ757_10540 [Agromyces sp. SYSU K20354]|uniref:hypothetical protein n=1 Tax=Agromyces cavernae TaxID=2898659 RepID=UPI001E619846|nr:hypothetical protein [Agromyces cavernae]MCD2442710.1 hypothetical protein [Agromyces cavernae]